VDDLTGNQLKDLTGNGIHAHVFGSLFLFVLALSTHIFDRSYQSSNRPFEMFCIHVDAGIAIAMHIDGGFGIVDVLTSFVVFLFR